LGFWLSLLLYGLVLTGVLLVVRFPAEKVEGYLAVKIATLSHGAAVDIGQCGYTFPAMLRCDHLAIGTSGKKEEMVVLENLTISPLTSGFGLKYNLAGEIAGGTFRTVAEFSPLNKTVALRSLALASLDLSRAGFVKQGLQREISGLLDFSGSMAVSLDGGGVITQEGKLSVREGDFVLRQQILLADRLQMAPMEVKLSYGKGVLQLRDGSLRGKQLVVDFAGELQPDDTLATWKMALKGSMTPVQEYVGGNPQLQRVVKRLQRQFTGDSLPYMVSGSLGVPHFRFGSQ
jgi:type II secretion system protein N